MSVIDLKSLSTITTEFRAQFTGAQLIEILRAAGVVIPMDAKVSFHVPSGGDYSNCDIDVTAENPVYLEWKVLAKSS